MIEMISSILNRSNPESSDHDQLTFYNLLPCALRESHHDLSSKKLVRESHALVNLCDVYTDDWKTGDHYLTDQGDKDWANEKETIQCIFYHFCGGKTIYEQLPLVDFASRKEIVNFVDDRPALRLRVKKKDVGAKIGQQILYFSEEGNLIPLIVP